MGVKRVMRYLQGTKELGLNFVWKRDMQLPIVESYADADWAGDCSGRKSINGVINMINGTPVSWKSKKQVGVALSSTEAEYVSISECVKITKWVRMMLMELNLLSNCPTVIHEDNSGAILWSSGEKRAKDVDIRYHFVADEVRIRTIRLQYFPTEDMLADALTKALSSIRMEKLRKGLGVNLISKQSH